MASIEYKFNFTEGYSNRKTVWITSTKDYEDGRHDWYVNICVMEKSGITRKNFVLENFPADGVSLLSWVLYQSEINFSGPHPDQERIDFQKEIADA